jgi:RNA polymerase sigma-70 factor, ECF subfamily
MSAETSPSISAIQWPLPVTREATGAEVTDETLVLAAQSGDPEAFALLVARYRRVVFAYAYARLRDREETEDVAQEVFIRAYQSLGRLRAGGRWEAWLMRILRNLCHDTLRRKRVRKTEPLDVSWLDDGTPPETRALENDRRRRMAEAIAELPEKYQVPLTMHYMSGCTYRQVAAALGLPESTVVGRMSGALRRLRQQLGTEGEG